MWSVCANSQSAVKSKMIVQSSGGRKAFDGLRLEQILEDLSQGLRF